VLLCHEDYWNHYEFDKTDKLQQSCSYKNCKQWDETKPSSTEITAKTCSKCWEKSDVMDNYDTFPAKDKYNIQKIKGINKEMPFLAVIPGQ